MPSSLPGLANGAINNLGSGFASGLASTTTYMIQKGVNKIVSSGTDVINRGIADIGDSVNNIASIGLEVNYL